VGAEAPGTAASAAEVAVSGASAPASAAASSDDSSDPDFGIVVVAAVVDDDDAVDDDSAELTLRVRPRGEPGIATRGAAVAGRRMRAPRGRSSATDFFIEALAAICPLTTTRSHRCAVASSAV
jgi:hypothetical protein